MLNDLMMFLNEEMHPELYNILNSDEPIERKHKRFVKRIRDLIANKPK